MSINLIAILLSLAMMLTGVGGEGQPAEAARSLVLRNINVTYNGNALRLDPQARIGVSTDGQKALLDFGVDLGEDRLLPVQLGVSDAGLTALFAGSGVSVNVPAGAIDAAVAQAGEMLGGQLAEAQGQNAELIAFLTDEFFPAYAALVEAAADSEKQAAIQAACKAVYEAQVDRGEGVPAVAEIDGETYDVTAYSYTISNEQMIALVEAIYTADPILSDYYAALFKLYSLTPEESGLTDIDSFTALFEKFGLQTELQVEEQINAEAAIDIMDAVLTLDMGGMVAAVEQLEVPEGEAGETAPVETPVALQPLVMNLHSLETGDYTAVRTSFNYEAEGQGMEFDMQASRGVGTQDVELTMVASANGNKTAGCKVSAFQAEDGEGGTSYSLALRTVVQDTAKVDASFYGVRAAGGTSENSVALSVQTPAQNLDVSFDLDVTAEPIEDRVSGLTPTVVIDDLSPEALEKLGEDQALMGAMMQVLGAFTTDAARLAGDPGVQSLMALLKGEAPSIDVDDLEADAPDALEPGAGENADYSYLIDDAGLGIDDEPAEDDGILPFGEPQLTWLPQGWSVASTDVDTAYDWVEMSLLDENGEECAYAIFFADPEEGAASYVVAADGTVAEGREINVTDFGEGGLSVTLRDAGVYANMMFTSEAIDIETIGRIVAGMAF